MKLKLIEKLLEMALLESEPKVESNTESGENPFIGKHVIVRCRDAGVHYGVLKSVNGRSVELIDSRRMWRWWAAKQMTLSAVAEFGLNHEKDLRIQNELDYILLLDACEVIPCYQACIESFAKVKPYDDQ